MVSIVLYFTLSHVISFLCSIFESVLLSCNASYIALLKKRGKKVAFILEDLKSHIDRPLAGILTLNTISHTFGAAGVGASVVETFGDKWLALASVILTLTMLYWTEMLPKTMGALYWKKLAPYCAKPIKWLIVMTYPFVFTFNLFARIFHQKQERITEDDIRIALEEGAQAGVIEEEEQEMVENIFRLGDRRVGVLMVPRVDINWIDLEDPPEKVRDQVLELAHHRFPLCRGEIDQVVGVVHTRDLLEKAWLSQDIDLESLARPPLYVNENQHVFELMDHFRRAHEEMALVTDEYGVIQGVVTLGDIMRAIVKDVDIEDGGGQILKVNNRSWLLDGRLPVDEFKEVFHIDHLPNEERARYRTLSGLCMNQLEAIPKKGDLFEIGAFRFEILKVRKRRVEKILFTRKEGIS